MAGLNDKTAVFLDRDGTINEDKGYIRHPSEVCLIPGAALAIKALNDRGIKVVVVSNQSGVARGFFSLHDLVKVNTRLIELLKDEGNARLDALYCCPHLPDDACKCRKPAVGLVKKATREHNVKCSYMVGDKGADIGLARRAGARAVLVRTGHGEKELAHMAEDPDYIAKDLTDAVAWILSDLKGAAEPLAPGHSMPGGGA